MVSVQSDTGWVFSPWFTRVTEMVPYSLIMSIKLACSPGASMRVSSASSLKTQPASSRGCTEPGSSSVTSLMVMVGNPTDTVEAAPSAGAAAGAVLSALPSAAELLPVEAADVLPPDLPPWQATAAMTRTITTAAISRKIFLPPDFLPPDFLPPGALSAGAAGSGVLPGFASALGLLSGLGSA